MSAETVWSAVADAAHRDWVDSERDEKLETLEAEVIRLCAEIEQLHAKLDKKEGQRKLAESECASMRKDAERRLDLNRATLENTEWRHGARNIHAELCREVDAAMGASA
ncbi:MULTISPECIES: hypothetical protein [unclassified Stenotrophomonas maltophilia group]|uniref:hypothetical protein n=1 Tax=unclassified Stenotrophomonas maltophilia group TaxID=2961925 RepID=UPI003BF85D07